MPSRDGVGVLSAPPEAGGPAAGAPLGCVGTSVFSKWDKLSPPSFWLLLLWMVLLSPTPQATSLPPALRAAPAWLMLPSCPLPWLMPCFWDHIPAGSQLGTFPMSHGGQHSHPCKIHPGEAGYQLRSLLVFMFQALSITCLSRWSSGMYAWPCVPSQE